MLLWQQNLPLSYESTLSDAFLDLQREVAYQKGYGRNNLNWSAAQLANIMAIIKSGYRRFCYPPRLPGQAMPHSWSFIRVVDTLTTVADQEDYTLPDDFGSIDGPITYDPVVYQRELTNRSELEIRRRRSEFTGTGQPTAYAIRPIRLTGTGGQRWQLMLSPKPDAAYTLIYRYSILPDAMAEAGRFPIGGMIHAETLLESCLAVAEERLDDTAALHNAKFLQLLDASIGHDQRLAPEFMGYVGSGRLTDEACTRHSYTDSPMKYNGVSVDLY